MGGRGSDLLRLRAKVDEPVDVLGALLGVHVDDGVARRLVAAAKATHVGLERLRVIDGAHQLHARYRVAAGMCLGRLLQEQDLGSLVGRGDGRVGARAAKARHNDVVFGIPLDGLLKGGCLSGLLRHGKRGRGAAGQDGSRGAGDKAPSRDLHRVLLSMVKMVPGALGVPGTMSMPMVCNVRTRALT